MSANPLLDALLRSVEAGRALEIVVQDTLREYAGSGYMGRVEHWSVFNVWRDRDRDFVYAILQPPDCPGWQYSIAPSLVASIKEATGAEYITVVASRDHKGDPCIRLRLALAVESP